LQNQKSNNCFNCGQLLKYKDGTLSDFCPNCGQKNRPKTLSFLELTKNAVGALFSLENKFFVSLFALLFKPGRLTHDFINGKRVKFVKPFRLYIFSGFLNALLLAIFLFTFDGYDYHILHPMENKGIHFKFSKDTKNETLKDLINNREKYKKNLIEHRKNEKESLKFMQFISKKQIEHIDITAADFYRNLLKSISYLNLILIPILAVILYLFYLRKSTFVDNIIHATHIFTILNFTMVALTLILFLNRFESNIFTLFNILIASCLNLYFLIYFYMSMKKFKGENHVITILKYIGVNTIFPIIYYTALAISIAVSIIII